MNAVDPRTRTKVVLVSDNTTARISLPNLVFSNLLFVLALGSAKDSILFSDADIFWVVVRVLGCGAFAVIVAWIATCQSFAQKPIEWPTVGFASLVQMLRVVCLMVALVRLPYTRVVIITQFSSLWMSYLLRPPSKQHASFIVAALSFSFLSSATFSSSKMWSVAPAYIALALEAFAASILEHTQGVLVPSLGHSTATAITVVGAFVCNGTLYSLHKLLVSPESSAQHSAFSLMIIPLLAIAILYSSPRTSSKMSLSSSPQDITLSYIVVLVSTSLFAYLAFSEYLTSTDVVVAASLCYGMRPGGQAHVRRESPYAPIAQLSRAYLKSILANPESRKIFYFLVLNMCYMLVQMLYGIWTNSLGLISDAIHMAFDCMAIGVGLIASVMARWAPNERFTYGYGRIETLSGFSNGVFLILISIFIVFEAIERLMNPPDMNTSQLLLVSSLGLAVNLFGMFAMGGHHHGGHSHSHSHGHGHSHSTSHSGQPITDGHAHQPQFPQRLQSDACESLLHSEHGHSHSDIHRSRLHAHSHSHSDAHHEDGHYQLPTAGDPGSTIVSDHEHTFHTPTLSPITPNYDFGHDLHFEKHHVNEHTPNLHDHSHTHEHGHEGHSHNMRGVFLHVMADTLGSIGVIISTLLIQYYDWTGFDPIASLFIAVLIAASVVPLVIDTGKVLMLDLSDRRPSINNVLSELHHIEGLESYSMARFWPKDDAAVIGSIHVRVTPSSSFIGPGGPHSMMQGRFAKVDRVVERVDALLRTRITGLEELSIQVEAGGADTTLCN